MLALALFVVVLAQPGAPAQAASVYKWVDENGNVVYSQTPPPDSGQSVQQREVDGGAREELAPYCRAVGKFAYTLADAMARGVALATAVSYAGAVRDEVQDMGGGDAQLQEIAYFVFSMENGLRAGRVSLSQIADLARDRCMSGRFAVLRSASRSGGATRSGTGWFMDRGVVVTSLHVVNDAESITLVTADGREVPATLLYSDREHDLAMLSTEVVDIPGLPVQENDAGIGTPVFTIGFPHSSVMGIRPKLSDGVISSTAGLRDDPTSYQISVPVQSGNSGGPLLDMSGSVVGVVSAKLSSGRMQAATGDATENVNYAVKSVHVLGLSGLRGGGGAGGGQSLQELARAVEQSVVRILAR